MKKVLFIDRDGTLIKEPEGYQIDSFEKLDFYPNLFTHLRKIAQELDYTLVMITNQDGLGTESFPEETFWPVHNFMLKTLQAEGITFDQVLIDKSFPHQNLPTRKPGTGLLGKYLDGSYDLENSFVIGDRLSDIELAKNLGAKGIYLGQTDTLGQEDLTVKKEDLKPFIALETSSWEDIYFHLAIGKRQSKITRNTKETKIAIELNLDGEGNSDIQTGLHFFDHMLDQLAKHSGADLKIKVEGDLQVDEHHTIEDTAIALGEAYRETLGIGVFQTQVKKFVRQKTVPHMGWNQLASQDPTLKQIQNAFFYFAHSYYVPINPFTIASTEYEEDFTCMMKKDNFWGCQFHPEKSGKSGRDLLELFLKQS
ncbi:MAG: histidinol-phosphatase [Flavobacteriaceae bacterium]|nr:MAG: histidinol-phosphatase [Flavobacteriaceae bacterium]